MILTQYINLFVADLMPSSSALLPNRYLHLSSKRKRLFQSMISNSRGSIYSVPECWNNLRLINVDNAEYTLIKTTRDKILDLLYDHKIYFKAKRQFERNTLSPSQLRAIHRNMYRLDVYVIYCICLILSACIYK